MSADLADAASGEWECMECGWAQAGTRARRPAKCPDCGAPVQALEFFAYGDDQDADASGAWPESPDDEDEADDELDDDDDERAARRFPPEPHFYR